MRVCRPGGKIGLANWTPESFIGKLFKTIGKEVPPPPGVKSPVMWGNKALSRGDLRQPMRPSRRRAGTSPSATNRRRISSTSSAPITGRRYKAFGAIDRAAQQKLQADILALIDKFNVAKDGTLVIPSEYLEIVITKRA